MSGRGAPPPRLDGRVAVTAGASRGAGCCPECGAPVEGRQACQELFERLIARDFSDATYFGVHRLAVDAYSLQHPERYMKSAKSAAAHLTGLVWALEYGGRPTVGSALTRWLDGHVDVTRPEPPPPAERGEVTIADVWKAADAEAHRELVTRWAASTWEAWSPHHATARSWVAEALA